MKSLLAILMSFLLVESPAFAIHGGYSLGGSTSLVGTYAGTLIPVSDTVQNGSVGSFGTNNLGLFTLGVPTTGVATGVVLIFSAGRTFFGNLQGVPDPKDPTGLVGVINATFNYNLSVPTTTTDPTTGITTTTISTVAVTASAEGSFSASTSTNASAPSSSSTGVTLSGVANIDVNQGFVLADGTPDVTESIVFDLEGFQQSTSFTGTTTLANNGTSTGG